MTTYAVIDGTFYMDRVVVTEHATDRNIWASRQEPKIWEIKGDINPIFGIDPEVPWTHYGLAGSESLTANLKETVYQNPNDRLDEGSMVIFFSAPTGEYATRTRNGDEYVDVHKSGARWPCTWSWLVETANRLDVKEMLDVKLLSYLPELDPKYRGIVYDAVDAHGQRVVVAPPLTQQEREAFFKPLIDKVAEKFTSLVSDVATGFGAGIIWGVPAILHHPRVSLVQDEVPKGHPLAAQFSVAVGVDSEVIPTDPHFISKARYLVGYGNITSIRAKQPKHIQMVMTLLALVETNTAIPSSLTLFVEGVMRPAIPTMSLLPDLINHIRALAGLGPKQ